MSKVQLFPAVDYFFLIHLNSYGAEMLWHPARQLGRSSMSEQPLTTRRWKLPAKSVMPNQKYSQLFEGTMLAD